MVNTEDSKTVLWLDDPNRWAAACLLPPWPPMTRGCQPNRLTGGEKEQRIVLLIDNLQRSFRYGLRRASACGQPGAVLCKSLRCFGTANTNRPGPMTRPYFFSCAQRRLRL